MVASSKREGLPINILEALSLNIPVVALKSRGTSDLLIGQDNCYVIEDENVDEFISKITYILSKKNISNSLNNNKLHKYSIENITNIMERIYFDKYEK